MRDVWELLPAFHAVAATEHLPSAAARLGLSPSALSRSVSALEEALGVSLFERVGRSLRLTEAGRRLRAGAEAAMREVDQAARDAVHEGVSGPLHLAATAAVVASFLSPALADLRRVAPAVVPWLHGTGASEALNAGLAEGRLDLALVEHLRPHEALQHVPLFPLDYGVYCGPGHALYDRTDAGEEEVLAWPIVGATVDEGDRLPPELRVNVRLRVHQMSTAVDFCASGEFLAALPRRIAEGWPGVRLWRLPHLHLPPGRLHLVHRRTGRNRAERALTELLLARARRPEPAPTGR